MKVSKILDSKGQPIEKKSIVGMSDVDGNWSGYQGLVIDPNSDMEDDGYCVAVFFDKEISRSMLWQHNRERCMDYFKWDEKYGARCPDILFTSDIWKMCFRIWFFRPEELVVESSWKMKNLVKRLFGSNFHRWYEFKEAFVPRSCGCTIRGCANLATELSLVNIWGSVYPVITCSHCHKIYNGCMSDDLPETQPPIPIAA